MTLTEAEEGYNHPARRATRTWKLFFFVSRMMLHRRVRAGFLPNSFLSGRLAQLSRVKWLNLVAENKIRECRVSVDRPNKTHSNDTVGGSRS